MFVGGCVCGGLRVRDCHRSTFITVVRELGKIGSAVGKVPRFDLRKLLQRHHSSTVQVFLERFLAWEVEHDTSSCIFEAGPSV